MSGRALRDSALSGCPALSLGPGRPLGVSPRPLRHWGRHDCPQRRPAAAVRKTARLHPAAHSGDSAAACGRAAPPRARTQQLRGRHPRLSRGAAAGAYGEKGTCRGCPPAAVGASTDSQSVTHPIAPFRGRTPPGAAPTHHPASGAATTGGQAAHHPRVGGASPVGEGAHHVRVGGRASRRSAPSPTGRRRIPGGAGRPSPAGRRPIALAVSRPTLQRSASHHFRVGGAPPTGRAPNTGGRRPTTLAIGGPPPQRPASEPPSQRSASHRWRGPLLWPGPHHLRLGGPPPRRPASHHLRVGAAHPGG
ncbi:hypothetical protein SVIOM74S_07641 [Streptomyces violarus]